MARRSTIVGLSAFLVLASCVAGSAQPGNAPPAMTFALIGNGGNCGRCAWIRAEGIITDRTPADFDAFVKDQQRQDMFGGNHFIILNSPGGNLEAAMELGRAFRDVHAYTEIAASVPDPQNNPGDNYYVLQPGVCASACFFAFIGGERRSLIANGGDDVTGSRLGIHRFSEATPGASPAATQRMAGSQAAYLSEMNVDSKILAVAAAVAPNTMRYLTPAEAASYRVITENLPAPSWAIERIGAGLALGLKGTAQNAETLTRYDYTLSLYCQTSPNPMGVLAVRIRVGGGAHPDPNANPGVALCHNASVGFDWMQQGQHMAAYARNCAIPDNVRERTQFTTDAVREQSIDMTIANAHQADDVLSFDLLLGGQAASLLDRVPQLWLEIYGYTHWASGQLPERIDLPWEQRENVTSLLARNCVK
jgi:hypothetical protein